jgi:hypothetical protein
MPSIIILIPYFGKLPDWSDLYFETLIKNETIDFHFFSDCDLEKYHSKNITCTKISFTAYKELVNSKLDFIPNIQNPYKLCDLRPLFAYLHFDVIKNYDFYGWTDFDIFFGDIRSFYTDKLLCEFDVFSTHSIRISGHLALFRNNRKNRNMYKKIYHWREALCKEEFVGIDEHGLTNAYTMTIFDKFNEKFHWNIQNFVTRFFSSLRKRKLYLKEQYTTPFVSYPWLDGTLNSAQPDVWFYTDGFITNSRDGKRNFMYFHFMNFKNSQWRHDGTPAPWEGKENICFSKVMDMKTGIQIDNNGIYPRI